MARNSRPAGYPYRKYRARSLGRLFRQNRRSVVPTNRATRGEFARTFHFTRWNGARHIRSVSRTRGSRSIRGTSSQVNTGALSRAAEPNPHHCPPPPW
ncbi:unnamed protein product [Gemmataceae bacterium]|nr:unnamed protein product [Gemmataceae bacterium]VTT96575.1 unnamed protein product [Gemmataceae bacterium]